MGRRLTPAQFMNTPGVAELIEEHYNNDIHEVWEGLKEAEKGE